MSKTPRKSTRSSSKKRTTAPLTWAAMERFFEYMNDQSEYKKRRVDARILAMSPAIVGVLDALRDRRGMSPALKTEIMSIARRAVGTTAEDQFGRDRRRTLVVADWALRCALPTWLDRLPRWFNEGASADAIRSLGSLQWTTSVVDAIATLSRLWISLDGAAQDRGTAPERAAVNVAHSQCGEMMKVLARSLSRSLDGRDGMDNKDRWFCDRTVVEIMRHGLGAEPEPAITKTLPALFDVLLAMQHGDSQKSIAERCVWPAAAKMKAA